MVPPTVTLALWRLRRTWRLLVITGVGMVAAVMLVCAVPLYSEVSMTAGLRGILNAAPQNADLIVYSVGEQVSAQFLQKINGELNQQFQQTLGPYLLPPQFSVQTQVYFLAQPSGTDKYLDTSDQMQFYGGSMAQVAPHITLVQGRLPRDNAQELEVALPIQAASVMKATVGSVLHIDVAFVQIPTKRVVEHLPVRVVGIFDVKAAAEPFWHQFSFDVMPRGAPPQRGNIYTGLISNANFITFFSNIFAQPRFLALSLEEPVSYYWYYRLDSARIGINDLNTILSGVNDVQVNVSNNFDLNQAPYTEQTKTIQPSDILEQFAARVPVARVPVMSLLFLVLALVLFFVSMMADLLVDRQAEAIAVLRSRGASRRQIFGSLVTQSLGLGIVALILGPLLALLLVQLVARRTFSTADLSALSLLTSNPWQTLWDLRWYALASVGVGVLAMIVSLFRTVSRDFLSMRRESARTSSRPLWQRLNLDIVAAIIMLVGYGASLYVTGSGVLDPQLQLLLLTPLTLIGAVFLLLACLLLFLRLFPLLLQGGSWLATHNRSASPVLALAQMARAPRQSLRMTLLLALATAFAIFTLVFTASQQQRIVDVSGYQGGADFSGSLSDQPLSLLQQITTSYRHIPGVLSATAGCSDTATAGNGSALSFTVEIRGADANNFAQTAIWTPQDSTQPLSSLMAQLIRQRDTALRQNVVPAIVDATTWSQLNLYPGAPFTLSFSDGTVNFVALAKVQHIPTISDNAGYGNASSTVSSGGILVDYQTYASVYQSLFLSSSGATVPINYIWLRTKSDAKSLASVRHALSTGSLQLSSVYDRRATSETLHNDPLYLDLIVLLALGASTALLLALVGNLIASWLSARNRLTGFAVLRALGTPPRQIAGVLTWEQGIIYTTAIVLGMIFGFLLSALAVPVLVFTSVGSNGATSDISSGAFYIAQSVPPIQVIVPLSVGIALVALIVICVIALGMMIRVVSRPSIGQTLRLNED
jgi:ABC-type lipoprotein release transport system permease subunit